MGRTAVCIGDGTHRLLPPCERLHSRMAFVLKAEDMKLAVHRQACCSQDDQLGPLDMDFELDASCRLDALLATVMGARILQFSTSHTDMSSRAEGRELARVFSHNAVPQRATAFVAPPDALVQSLAAAGAIEFVFDRV